MSQLFCTVKGLLGVDDPRCQAGPGVPDAGVRTEFLAQASRRLKVVAAVLTGSVVVALLASVLTYDVFDNPYYDRIWLDRGRQLALFVLSVGMLVVANSRLHPRQVLAVGLAYELLGAAVISASLYAVEPALEGASTGVSWLGVWILLFPLVAPTSPRKTLVVSLLAATSAPVFFAAGVLAQGADWPSAGLLLNSFLPHFVVAGMAIVPASVVQRLAVDLGTAQDAASELGTYRLIEPLGRGGMGEVWRAEHKLLRRPAAIKVIQADALRGDVAQRAAIQARFEREAAITGALRSSHTVELYDFGRTENGAFYYVMELLEGIDLETLVERFGPLPPARAVFLLRQVCVSLAEAHARGLVHRDIKPANLLSCRLGVQFDVMKVLDFGLVAFSGEVAGKDDAKLTGEGAILGTPAYMSPEQADNRDGLDHRSDLYSLGCVAYWLLTGRAVFEQPSPLRVIVDHLKTQPERPSARLGRAIPAELEELVLACLAKDPADRPASAECLLERLEALRFDEPWSQPEARCWWREHLPELAAPPANADPSPLPQAAPVSAAQIALSPSR